ncbi:MAG: hypothetical protein OFPII_43550 [Osedax symbiont Rs1]|nr:MAG: hypothetical protein OFPII_43550 [Osedax symbiont Rs1]
MINLDEKHLNIVKNILGKHLPDSEIWVFGSRVTNRCKKYSDLDLLIRRAQMVDQKMVFRLMDAFEESELPIKVDVIAWSEIDSDFQKIVSQRYEVLEY